MVGIYLITNKVNGNQYVGQSVNIQKRWADHKTPSKKSHGTVLARALKKYGNENFEFSVLEECLEEMLDEREMFYIKTLCPIYNMNDGGAGNKGHHLSPQLKSELSKKGKMFWKSLSEPQKQFVISHNLTGRRKGYHLTEKQKQHLSQCAKKQFAGGMSAEHKSKIGAGNKVAMIGNTSGNKAIGAISIMGKCEWFYCSVIVAAQSIGCTPHEISDVLHGRRKSTHGFKFEALSQGKFFK